MGIRGKIIDFIESYRVKKLQKMLIKTDDDQKVIEALPSDEENFAYNFPKVVGSMQEIENKLEVVNNNIDEIIAEDVVRDTLSKLENDKAIKKVLTENKEELEKHNKIKNAIEAIRSNEMKLKLTQDYVTSLEDFEILKIFGTLKPPKDEAEKENIERIKIDIISAKIMYHIKKSGYAWHLDAFTYGFKDRAKISLLNNCLKEINRENLNSQNIDSKSKIKLVFDLLRLTDMKDKRKSIIIDEFKHKKWLDEEEAKKIREKVREDKIRKENQSSR